MKGGLPSVAPLPAAPLAPPLLLAPELPADPWPAPPAFEAADPPLPLFEPAPPVELLLVLQPLSAREVEAKKKTTLRQVIMPIS
jgi:hypothetical protein